MSKNILIINEYAGSPSYGMTFRHYYLAKEFNKKGYETTIISASYSHFLKKIPEMNGETFKDEKVDGVNFIWIKVIKYTKSFDKKRALKWLEFTSKLFFINKKLKSRPDVIICSTTELFAILPAYYLSKKYKAKLVFEVRDIWPLTLVKIGNFSEKNIFIRMMSWLERFSLRKSDIIVSNLSNYTKHIKSLGIDRSAVWVSNGIDLDEMKNIEELPFDLNELIPKNKFIVGYTGKLGVSNAILYLLESAKILKENKDIFFVIVGDGQEKENLKNFSKNLNNIIFIDSIKKKQIQSMLSLFNICYIGWKKENIYNYGVSANKIFDYMYSGKPILQSIDIDSDIVQKSNCGLCVESENSYAISEGIIKLFNMSEEERKQLGNNGKEYVLNNFTYDKLSDKFISILGN
ncbi:glycosyltransferase family 4 protein [Aliarcobacter butzleri]|uniref:glycosyltransferase family 4 protein n=1 Tax=Aliarcobacter butzleri TaxID=28197 RepID=UPI001EDA7FB3|nr:glycosyltransferase family 4 protein [Aliarcobacter butzleri]MCG3672271.1 glycosyltransferase family 4 protein [Aliarcobacter butzleri]MCG3717593.1 glycosyltransferase family 4 protein [Aliarcobacter butzleri]